jgi:pimeloyl-ACP methyl ester carboxylesterase
MGAVVGAQALAGDTPFSGGVLFSPFSNLDAMISATLQSRGIWWVPGMADDVRKRVREVIGVDASEISPEKAAVEIRVPALIVHGTKDEQIPVAQGRAVFDAIPGGRKEFLELPDAGHDDLVEFRKAWGKKTLRRTLDFLRQAG